MWVKFPLHIRGVKKKVIELMSVARDVSFLLHCWNGMWYICRDWLIADWLEVVVMDLWGVVLVLNLL
jgi:succinate dehydrogenase hydrophobic anchor subunit